ncbi:MAG: phosphonate metabolism transcriptional regulator PhnF [Shimia sp.]
MTHSTWIQVRDALARDIRDGTLQPGDRLATEPELAARFEIGRHSVRRAVEALAREGKLSVEQGRGTFVDAAPRLTYSIGPRTRARQNLVPQGYEVTSRFLGADRAPAPRLIAEALGLPEDAAVIESRRLTLADGVPLAFGAIYHDAARFPDIVERRAEMGSLTKVYESYGIADYLRGETRLHARAARPDEAKQLRQHPDMPVIVLRAVDVGMDGAPISFSEVVWSAARATFSVPGPELE